MKSGFAVRSSPNSSMTTNRCGSGSRSGRFVAPGRRSAHVGDVPGVLEDLLAALDLPGQAGVDALHEAGLFSRLVITPRRGEAGEGAKVAPPLVVDEHHRQVLGRVAGHQGEDEGAQQFGLAGAGRADAQSVRAHAEFGGFLEVEEDRWWRSSMPIGRAGSPLAARCPLPVEVEFGRIGDAKEGGEIDRPATGVPSAADSADSRSGAIMRAMPSAPALLTASDEPWARAGVARAGRRR